MVVFGSTFHPIQGNESVNINTHTGGSATFTDITTTNLTSTNSTLGTITGTSSTISGTSTTATLNVSGNATVTGNLNVNGTTTFLNTSNVDIKDALVRLGKTTDATVPNNYISGLEFDRGTANNLFQITYHEDSQLIKAGQPNSLLPLMLREVSPTHNNVLFWDGTGLKATTKNALDTRTLIDIYSKGETNSLLNGKSDTGHTHDDRYYTESETNSLFVDKTTAQTIGGAKTFTAVIKTDQIEPNTGNLHVSSLVVYPNDKMSLGTNQEPTQQFEIHGTAQQVGMNFHNGASDAKYSLGMYDNDFYLVTGDNLGTNRLLKITSSITDILTPLKLTGITQSLLGKILFYDATTKSVNYHDANTTNISEGTNLYFTNARARSSLSAGSGISYNSSTGVITNSLDTSNFVSTNSNAQLQSVSLTGSTSYLRIQKDYTNPTASREAYIQHGAGNGSKDFDFWIDGGYRMKFSDNGNTEIHVPKNTVRQKITSTGVEISQANDSDASLKLIQHDNGSIYGGFRTRHIVNTGQVLDVKFNNNATPLTIIDNNRVGINNTNPTKTLDVNGDVQLNNIYINNSDAVIQGIGMINIKTMGANSIKFAPNQVDQLTLGVTINPKFFKPVMYKTLGGSFPVIYETRESSTAFVGHYIFHLQPATFMRHTLRFRGNMGDVNYNWNRFDVYARFFRNNNGTYEDKVHETNLYAFTRGSMNFTSTGNTESPRFIYNADGHEDISIKIKINNRQNRRAQVQYKSTYTRGGIGSTVEEGSSHALDNTWYHGFDRVNVWAYVSGTFDGAVMNGRWTLEGQDVIDTEA